jgi:hypothetical protein
VVKNVFQTLEDRPDSDYDKLEQNGPYTCKQENSWLGEGYYFWDTFIDNAHWWGEVRKYPNGYIICQAKCDYNDHDCCDLVGNTEHMQEFIAAYIALTDAGLANGRTKVSRIIHYLKHEVKTFHFEAIRAYGTKSKDFRSKFAFSRFFVPGRENSIIDFKPAIQICFYSKNALGLRSYRIIYPEMYSQDEVV